MEEGGGLRDRRLRTFSDRESRNTAFCSNTASVWVCIDCSPCSRGYFPFFFSFFGDGYALILHFIGQKLNDRHDTITLSISIAYRGSFLTKNARYLNAFPFLIVYHHFSVMICVEHIASPSAEVKKLSISSVMVGGPHI